MRRLVLILFTLTAVTGFADEKKYGSFLLDSDIPDTLFFVDEIKANDSFELRKALRNHEIRNIVLASPGGNVWEGLQMAGIIFDKELRTYIPRGGICASACSFLFFAGSERLADGKLGVHQFISGAAEQTAQIGKAQEKAQFTVSEIIGFLNEFGTPAFVYERMFQDFDMYYFDPLELMQLNTELFGFNNEQKIAATKFILKKLDEQKNSQPVLSRKDLIALIQMRLKEIGCNPGPADGIWGRRTQSAAVVFAKKAGLPTATEQLITENFIKKLSEAPKDFCPKIASIKKEKRTTVAKPRIFYPLPGILSGTWQLEQRCRKVTIQKLRIRDAGEWGGVRNFEVLLDGKFYGGATATRSIFRLSRMGIELKFDGTSFFGSKNSCNYIMRR